MHVTLPIALCDFKLSKMHAFGLCTYRYVAPHCFPPLNSYCVRCTSDPHLGVITTGLKIISKQTSGKFAVLTKTFLFVLSRWYCSEKEAEQCGVLFVFYSGAVWCGVNEKCACMSGCFAAL